MALPKVTPGTYDYGAYANPKAVQYKGGQQVIGAAVGRFFGDVGKGYMDRMEQDKKDVKEITDDEVNMVGTVNPKIKASNIKDIKAFAEDYGKLKLAKRRNQLSDQEYIEAEAALQSQYQYLQLLPEIFESGIEGEIDLSRLKGKDAKRNLFLHKAMNSGNVRTSWDSNKKEFNLQWTSDDGETFTESLSGFISNTKDYLQLKNKFDFADADKQAGLAEIADLINKNDDYKRYMTDVVYTAEGPKSKINIEKATLGIAQSDLINGYEQKYGKDIYEDYLLPRGLAKDAEYDPNKHSGIVRKYIADNIVNKVQQIGNNVPVKTETSAKDPRSYSQQLTDQLAQTRLNMLKNMKLSNLQGASYADGQGPSSSTTIGRSFFVPGKDSQDEIKSTKQFRDLQTQAIQAGFEISLGSFRSYNEGEYNMHEPTRITIKDSYSGQTRELPLENITPSMLESIMRQMIQYKTSFIGQGQNNNQVPGLPIYTSE